MEKEITYHSDVHDLRICKKDDTVHLQISDNNSTTNIVLTESDVFEITDTLRDLFMND